MGKYGIRSNTICPGLIKTKFSQALWSNESIMKQVEHHLPLQRAAEPIEIAGLAVYLASSASSFTTGAVFNAERTYDYVKQRNGKTQHRPHTVHV